MKLLILSDFAAPYRIAVFKGLAKEHDIDLFFNAERNGTRDKRWYVVSDETLNFCVLSDQRSKEAYYECIKKIKEYDAVICYDPWHKRSRALQRLCLRKKIPYVLNADGALRINMEFPKKQVKTLRKYSQIIYLTKDLCIKYLKNFQVARVNKTKQKLSS